MAEALAGRLLLASPQLADPNFVHSVVLVLQHHDEGALGVILNRPTSAPLAEALPGWEGVVGSPAVLFGGGPVAGDGALCLARRQGLEEPPGWQRLDLPELPGLGLVDLDSEPAEVAARVERLRIFAGYAGWGAGQLESEIKAGGWYLLTAQASDPFTPHPGDLWGEVLRRQGGQLAMLSTLPLDPHLN
ncbi:MAG: YqgE/AlgH family protein [Candidatus Dormibacteraceae bacterium]